MLHNVSQLVVHATFHLLSDFMSDTFTLDPTSMTLEPGQKKVDFVLLSASNNNNNNNNSF